jgi:hypothetical protein
MSGNKKIDFIIPCHPKYFTSLKLAYNCIKNNISCYNNIYIYIISKENLNLTNSIFITDSRFDIYITKERIENIWGKKTRNFHTDQNGFICNF